MKKANTAAVPFLLFLVVFGISVMPTGAFAQAANAGSSAIAKQLGVIKTISGNTLTITPEAGPEVAVSVAPNAKIARINPGSKDLAPIQLADLQVGDQVRVRGYASTDGKSLNGLEVIVITRAAVAAVGDQIRQDWQKRGLGGLVNSVDLSAGTVTISVTGFGGKKDVVVHTAKNTVIRRYSPDSVKFDDAKPSTLAEIHPGDQLRTRGERSADGLQLTAEEIVSGSFRNIAGTVNSTDASTNTINVQDLLTKKSLVVRITADSQLHKLPPEAAQRIAMRLKGSMPSGPSGSNSVPPSGSAQGGVRAGNGATAQGGAGTGGAARQGGAPDFQQMLNRMPAVTISDLHKGDAVLIVATEGTGEGGTAITLLSGVEPILRAAPSGSKAMMLTPWSLGGAPGGDATE
jgi:hypothetical protein